MADQGTMLTSVDYGAVSIPELVKAAHECERQVFPDVPKDQLDAIQPIWRAMIERLEGGKGGRTF